MEPELGTSGQAGVAPALPAPVEMSWCEVCPDGRSASQGARHAVPCHAMLRHAALCCAVPRHATLPCRATLRRATLPSPSARLATTGRCTKVSGTFLPPGETPEFGALGDPLPAPARGQALGASAPSTLPWTRLPFPVPKITQRSSPELRRWNADPCQAS